MASLFVLEAANLFVGDSGPNNSKHLNLQKIKLPTLEEITAQHHAGGAIGEIEVGGLGVKALACSFDIVGVDPQIYSQFGVGSPSQIPYTMYGAMRDKNGGRAAELKAIMWARLTKIDPSDVKRGDLHTNAFELKQILHYELYIDTVEKYFWDFFASDFRIDGAPQNADVKKLLRISGT